MTTTRHPRRFCHLFRRLNVALTFSIILVLAYFLAYANHAAAEPSISARMLGEGHARHVFAFAEVPVLVKEASENRGATLRRAIRLVEELSHAEIGDAQRDDWVAHLARLNKHARGSARETRLGARFREEAVLPNGTRLIESNTGSSITRPGEFRVAALGQGEAFRIELDENTPALLGNRPYKLSLDAAERLGLALIRQLNLVPESERSQLFVWRTAHTYFTGKQRDPGERCVSTEIRFGRIIAGVPVVGQGSFVAIRFASGDAVSSINVDWPRLLTTERSQRPVTEQAFLERVRGAATAQKINMSVEAVGDSSVSHIVNIDSTLCGYYDTGARHGVGSQLQLACAVSLSDVPGNVGAGVSVPPESGWKTVVPLAEHMESDSRYGDIWMEKSLEAMAKESRETIQITRGLAH